MNSSEYRYFEVVGEDTGKILDDSLDARLVEYTKDPDDGYEKSHLKGHTVIAQLNRIFGYAGHSWEVTSRPILIGGEGVDRQTGEILSPIGYTCTGRLTVKTKSGPVSFDGVGVERLDGVSFNSHDKALKGAETDAMKRAARHLGTQFGLSLYFDGAFDVPAHFRVDSGESPAKAEAPAARQPGGRDQSQSRGGDQAQSRRPAQQRGNVAAARQRRAEAPAERWTEAPAERRAEAPAERRAEAPAERRAEALGADAEAGQAGQGRGGGPAGRICPAAVRQGHRGDRAATGAGPHGQAAGRAGGRGASQDDRLVLQEAARELARRAENREPQGEVKVA